MMAAEAVESGSSAMPAGEKKGEGPAKVDDDDEDDDDAPPRECSYHILYIAQMASSF